MSAKDAPAIRWLREPVIDSDGVQATSGFSKDGEHPDPVPLAPPAGLRVGLGDPLRETLRRILAEERSSFQAMVEGEGFESEDEANDFDVQGDIYPPDPGIPWEGPFEFTEAQEAAERAARAAARSGNPPTGAAVPRNPQAQGAEGGGAAAGGVTQSAPPASDPPVR